MDDSSYAFNFSYNGDQDPDNPAYLKGSIRGFANDSALIRQDNDLVGLEKPFPDSIPQESQNTTEIQFDEVNQSQSQPTTLASGTSSAVERSSQSFPAGPHNHLPFHPRGRAPNTRISQPTGNDAAPWTGLESTIATVSGTGNYMLPPQSATNTDSGYDTYPRQASTGSVISGPPGFDVRGAQTSLYANPSSGHRVDQDMHSVATHQSMDDQSMASFSNNPNFQCDVCHKFSKSSSEFKKHKLRHDPQFFCGHQGCTRQEGFTTKNDLDRHMKTVHKVRSGRYWKCFVPSCPKAAKQWPRLDNFKAHIIRMHGSEYVDEYIKQAEIWWEGQDASKDSSSLTHGSHGTIHPSDLVSTTDSAQHDAQTMGSYPENRYASSEFGQTKRKRDFTDAVTPQFPFNQSQVDDIIEASKRRRAMAEPSGRRRPIRNSITSDFAVPTFSRDQASAWKPYLGGTSATPMVPMYPPAPMSHLDTMMGYKQSFPAQRAHTIAGDIDFMQDSLFSNESSSNQLERTNAQLSSQEEFAGMGGAMFVSDYPTSAVEPHQDIDLPSANDMQRAPQPRSLLALTGSQMLDLSAEDKQSIIQMLQGNSAMNQESRSVFPSTFAGDHADGRKQYRCTKMISCPGGKKRCPKTFDRGNELRKHEARHERKFACTYDNCYKRFGSKWEWRRHEQTQHEQAEVWRCDRERGQDHRQCMRVFQDKDSFRQHLNQQHKNSKKPITEESIGRCKVAKRFQGPYWCGFCQALIKNEAIPGPDREKARYDHIHAHIEEKRNMDEWIALEARGKTRKDLQSAGAVRSDSIEEDSDSDASDSQEEAESDSPSTQTPTHSGSYPLERAISAPGNSLNMTLTPTSMDVDPMERFQSASFSTGMYSLQTSSVMRGRSLSYGGGEPLSPLMITCCVCNLEQDHSKLREDSKCLNCDHIALACKNCFKLRIDDESTSLVMDGMDDTTSYDIPMMG